MKAYLILADGSVYTGESFGANRDAVCEVVFDTAMTGYTEALSDPAYYGQGIVMTYPIQGNCGVNYSDMESRKLWARCLIVREYTTLASNFRNEITLDELLKKYDVPAISGVDTRAITKKLRNSGTMGGYLTTNPDFNKDEIVKQLQEYTITDAVKNVTRSEVMNYHGSGKKVALIDVGAKDSVIEALRSRGCDVTVYPAFASAEEILASEPDGIMLSNGPGDPSVCTDTIETVKKLYETDLPMFALCLGHQILALATGAKHEKLKYGHRGGGHPVKDLETGTVYVTAQNHSYVISEIDENVAEITHISVNDGTIEGLRYKNKNIFTVQWHPEGCPGPQETEYVFDKFIDMMGGNHNA